MKSFLIFSILVLTVSAYAQTTWTIGITETAGSLAQTNTFGVSPLASSGLDTLDRQAGLGAWGLLYILPDSSTLLTKDMVPPATSITWSWRCNSTIPTLRTVYVAWNPLSFPLGSFHIAITPPVGPSLYQDMRAHTAETLSVGTTGMIFYTAVGTDVSPAMEESPVPKLSLAPVPAYAFVTLTWKGTPAPIEILDLEGRVVARRAWSERISLEGVPAGVFWVKVGSVAAKGVKATD